MKKDLIIFCTFLTIFTFSCIQEKHQYEQKNLDILNIWLNKKKADIKNQILNKPTNFSDQSEIYKLIEDLSDLSKSPTEILDKNPVFNEVIQKINLGRDAYNVSNYSESVMKIAGIDALIWRIIMLGEIETIQNTHKYCFDSLLPHLSIQNLEDSIKLSIQPIYSLPFLNSCLVSGYQKNLKGSKKFFQVFNFQEPPFEVNLRKQIISDLDSIEIEYVSMTRYGLDTVKSVIFPLSKFTTR